MNAQDLLPAGEKSLINSMRSMNKREEVERRSRHNGYGLKLSKHKSRQAHLTWYIKTLAIESQTSKT